MKYLVPWVANVINCFFIGFTWYKKKYLYLLGIFFLQIFLYLICAHKVFLIAPFLVTFLLFSIQKEKVLTFMLIVLITVIISSFVLFKNELSIRPASLFIRRGLYVPAQVSNYYYDFFSKNPKTNLAQSKIGLNLAENPYGDFNLPLPRVMGLIYRDSSDLNMNTGYVGDAYMNFGFAGVIFYSFLLGLTLVIIDTFSRNVSMYITISCLTMPIFKLMNSALSTVV